MRPTRWYPAAAVTAALLVGCGGDEEADDGASVATTTTVGVEDDDAATATTTSPPPSTTTTTTTTEAAAEEVPVVTLTYAGGEVTTGRQRVEVGAGEQVRLEVTSDVVEEVHVHGYDLEVALVPGQPAMIDIVGDLPGVWEVELHGSGDLLCELAVAG